MLCLIYSLIIIYILKKYNVNKKIVLLISFILFVVGQIFTIMISNVYLYDGIILKIITLFKYAFGNSGRIFQGMFYICLGMLFFDNIKYFKQYICIYIIVNLLIIILSNYFDFNILKIIFNILIFLICISISLKDKSIYYYFRKIGVIMYFTHMIFYYIYSLVVGFKNCKGPLGFIFCLLNTLIFSVFICYINRNKKIKFLNVIFN